MGFFVLKELKVIEDRTAVHEIAQSFAKHLQQFLLSFNADNSRWRTIEEVLDLLFYHRYVEVRNLQNVLSRKHDQWRLFSLLQGDFVSTRDVQVMVRRTWEVISEHTGVNGTTLNLCKEGVRA
ncbi:MAG: hypothetical protein ABSA44_09390 [Bacteroidota bacterium]